MTGIIGAMPSEVELLVAELEDARQAERAGYLLHHGTLRDRRVIIAECGIGKANGAALAMLLLTEGAARVIFTGVAGALDPALAVGDIVISHDAVQHDVDVSALGYEPGQVPGEPFAWLADPGLVSAAEAACRAIPDVRVVTGRILSGDSFVADPRTSALLHARFAAACVEMEGAAVAQVCSRAGIPFVIIRSVSDTADGQAGADFRKFTELAARRAKQVVLNMLQRI
jgi:adenosylhomocysteine nucleosidase